MFWGSFLPSICPGWRWPLALVVFILVWGSRQSLLRSTFSWQEHAPEWCSVKFKCPIPVEVDLLMARTCTRVVLCEVEVPNPCWGRLSPDKEVHQCGVLWGCSAQSLLRSTSTIAILVEVVILMKLVYESLSDVVPCSIIIFIDCYYDGINIILGLLFHHYPSIIIILLLLRYCYCYYPTVIILFVFSIVAILWTFHYVMGYSGGLDKARAMLSCYANMFHVTASLTLNPKP